MKDPLQRAILFIVCSFQKQVTLMITKSQNNRQTNAQQGVRGRANHPFAAPPAALFFCTVNGTFSFWRDKKRMWGWNCGFRKMPRYDWQRIVRTKYEKRIPALRTNLFRRSLRRGTFHRRKVPKDHWGVSMRPRPLATPQAPEGYMLSAFR